MKLIIGFLLQLEILIRIAMDDLSWGLSEYRILGWMATFLRLLLVV